MSQETALAVQRICRTCNAAKAMSEFYKDARYPKGDIHCAACRREKVRIWRTSNKARAAEIHKRSYLRNPEAARKRANEWYKKNHARQKAYMADRRKTHAEQIAGSKLKSAFGITLTDYNAMLEKQNHQCAICGKSPEQNKKRLAVDHCHTTNKIRGLLCSTCNKAIGLFSDNIPQLQSAIQYLSQYE